MFEEYRAKLVRVIDGDTVVFLIDQGFYNWTEQHIRVNGVDCPERTDRVRWAAATDFTLSWLDEHAQPYVLLTPQKVSDDVFRQTFARFVAGVYSMDKEHSLAADLIAEGHIK